MTTPSATTAVPSEDQLLIQEAIRRRRLQRSGKFLAGVITLAVFFGAVGFLLTFHSGTITYTEPYSAYTSSFPLGDVLVPLGILALLVAVVFVVCAVTAALPDAPWGDPAPGDCPVCGNPALRQDDLTVREGLSLDPARGTVTLCTSPDCTYAAAAVAG
jgi:hypothetical protein